MWTFQVLRDSLKEYFPLVGKWWWILVMSVGGAIIGAGFDVWGWDFPDWAWVLIAVSGVLMAQFLAFHAMRVKRVAAQIDIAVLSHQLEQEKQDPSKRLAHARKLLRDIANEADKIVPKTALFKDMAKSIMTFREWRTNAASAVKAIKGAAEEKRFLAAAPNAPEQNNVFIGTADANEEYKAIDESIPTYKKFLLDLSEALRESDVEPSFRVPLIMS